MKIRVLLITTLFVIAANSVLAQTSDFTYQGKLNDGANPANGSYDFEFRLFDAAEGGVQFGVIQRNSVFVTNGIFTVTLDFNADVFPGADRFLEISVRSAGGGDFVPLNPRQKINSSPYAVKSLNAENAVSATTANNALQLGDLAANQYVLTGDARLSDARDPLPNSPNYIRNSTIRQTAANINISGTAAFGSHGDFGGVLSTSSNFFVAGNSTLQGNLTVNGALTATNTANILAATQFTGGNFSGALYNGSVFNSTGGFFQDNVRILNTPGTNNTFAGRLSGSANTGTNNSFFGFNAGNDNTSADNNAFFGSEAGAATTTGGINTFLGSAAGKNNETGSENTFVGTSAGFNNLGGRENTFMGRSAGRLNVAGTGNTFVGFEAGRANTTSYNSFFGHQSGDQNTTGSSNSFFGTSSGGANLNGIGNSFFGRNAGLANTSGSDNSFFGLGAGDLNTSGSSNTFIGEDAGNSNVTGGHNTAIGNGADMGSSGLNFATAIGADAEVTTSNTVVIGRSSDTVRIPGILRLPNIGFLSPANFAYVCVDDTGLLFKCPSNLTSELNVCTTGGLFENPLDTGDILVRCAFSGGVSSTKPIAAQIDDGKSDRNAIVLANAVNEQQIRIDNQKKELAEQQKLIAELKTLVCAQNAQAALCK